MTKPTAAATRATKLSAPAVVLEKDEATTANSMATTAMATAPTPDDGLALILGRYGSQSPPLAGTAKAAA